MCESQRILAYVPLYRFQQKTQTRTEKLLLERLCILYVFHACDDLLAIYMNRAINTYIRNKNHN